MLSAEGWERGSAYTLRVAGILVVGLGPGSAEWVTEAARSALRLPGARVFARTELHPALPVLLEGIPFESFDALYQQAESIDRLHEAIVERLVQAAEQDRRVVFAVPGDGRLGEAVVDRLLERGVPARVIPGVPLGAAALGAAHLPAGDGVQSVEATSLGGSGVGLGVELNPRWPAVVTGVFSRAVAGDVKLALQRVYPDDHAVLVVHHPGLADESVAQLPLADLDRGSIELDHLTHVVLPPVRTTVPTGSPHGLRAIVARLRAPEIGCPWDLEQTHRSLAPFVVEEAYEVVDAIEHGTSGGLMDELGDVLLQVALHAEIADQAGDFDWNDVVRAISAKLVRRHPHVFGEVEVRGAEDVVRNWAQLKAAERVGEEPAESALDGVPRSLPGLKQAAELGRKAAKAGFDWADRSGAVDKMREELDELLAATTLEDRREELGDLLWMLANLAMRDGIDAEEAVRAASRKFALRFRELERIGRERGWTSVRDRPTGELLEAWAEAKRSAASLPPPSADG